MKKCSANLSPVSRTFTEISCVLGGQDHPPIILSAEDTNMMYYIRNSTLLEFISRVVAEPISQVIVSNQNNFFAHWN